jgi:DNA-binding GntR family transcriptional regulator
VAESHVITRLRESVLSLELPPGQPLSERGLEPLLGASRTPIRAALVQLAGEGLVQREGRGWIVAPLDLDELASLTEYREVLETAGVRLAIARASAGQLDAVAALVPSLEQVDDAEEGVGSGTAFHHALAALSGNHHLIDALDGVLTRLHRTRWLEVRSPATRERASQEHRAIVAALMDRDTEAAEIAIREHLHGTMRRLQLQLEDGRQALRARGITIAGGNPSQSG